VRTEASRHCPAYAFDATTARLLESGSSYRAAQSVDKSAFSDYKYVPDRAGKRGTWTYPNLESAERS